MDCSNVIVCFFLLLLFTFLLILSIVSALSVNLLLEPPLLWLPTKCICNNLDNHSLWLKQLRLFLFFLIAVTTKINYLLCLHILLILFSSKFLRLSIESYHKLCSRNPSILVWGYFLFGLGTPPNGAQKRKLLSLSWGVSVWESLYSAGDWIWDPGMQSICSDLWGITRTLSLDKSL